MDEKIVDGLVERRRRWMVPRSFDYATRRVKVRRERKCIGLLRSG